MHTRGKSRSCDNYLCIKDSESLDSSIQHTLSSLYAPFGATAATVLWQLFSVVERQYRGDGLRCFLDFLLPTQRILSIIQRETRLRFKGLVPYHEGWPLCIHEKVVLQLAPLHKVRLRPGDFYLQVVPLGRRAAKLVVKCLSGSGRAVAELTVPESMYGSVFTTEFLQHVSRERGVQPLHSCLLSAGTAVYRSPWKSVVSPAMLQQLLPRAGRGSTGTLDSRRSSRDSLASEYPASEPENTPPQHTSPHHTAATTQGQEQGDDRGGSSRPSSSRSLSFSTDLSNPSPRRRHPRDMARDSASFETRRLFRKSYMEALQNPMNLGSSSESILEESPRPSSAQRRVCARAWLGGEESCSESGSVSPLSRSPSELSRTERRSKSLERTGKASQVKGHRARSSSGSSSGASPKKLLNGYTLLFGLESAFSTERRSGRDSGLADPPSVSESRVSVNGGEESPSSISSRTSLSPPAPCGLTLPSLITQLPQELLTSAAVTLPGNCDRSGHCVVQVSMRKWKDQSFTCRDLTCLLGYYCSTLCKEKRDLGLTVVVDARRQQTSPVLFSALSQLQASLPNALYSVLLLCDKEASLKPERDFSVPCEVLTSLKALLKHIDSSQLTKELDGTFSYDHNHYIQFREKMEQFSSNCSSAILSLQHSITILNSSRNLDTAKEVSEAINGQRNLMGRVLEDTHLNSLRMEGGTFLARVRKEETSEIDSYRDAVDMAFSLYNQMDEEVHKLVILSNKSLHQLENLLELRTFQEESEQIKHWFTAEGEKLLVPLGSLSLTLSSLQEMRRDLERFRDEAEVQHKQAVALMRESRHVPSSMLVEFKQLLSSFLQRADARRSEVDILLKLYEFYDSVEQWMAHCEDYLQSGSVTSRGRSPEVLRVLESYHSEAQKFSLENFSTLNRTVSTLGSERELQRWNLVWTRCQETRRRLEETLTPATEKPETPETPETPREPEGTTPDQDSSDLSDLGSSVPLSLEKLRKSSVDSGETQDSGMLDSEDRKTLSAGALCRSRSLFPFSPFPLSPDGGKVSPSLLEDTDSDCTVDSSFSCRSEPPHTTRRKPPLKKIMKKTFSHELSTRDHHTHGGYTGIHIRGLEVTNNVSLENKLHRPEVTSPPLVRSLSLSSASSSSASRAHCRGSQGEISRHSSKMQHIMDEMISTEREYVRSLSYIMEHYFPEMERLDLPQDLRGKRSIIFGNLEKLCDFHSQYFLKDLERCAHTPLSVSSCFLRHEEQFGMYALYSKNKPRSDALLISHGNSFFKNKQVELEDKMDLASYLLKPIQRMSKYALLLKDLIKECGQSQEQELADLRAAEEMVKFQLRHGNDLLAMDAIRGCDVNLKEQGQLRCQDEFMVWCGRKKYLRHVFLFEDLILFSKTKKIEGGYDIYIYKQSFKTAEIGMTENVGESGLRFEIWFRRRKSQDTFILQANSAESKTAWTAIIGKILWRQALRNRELRMQEMVSMGIGNKPFMDIKPSEAAISDRAVDYSAKGTESRSRSSVSTPPSDHCSPFKRPHSTISNSSSSSSGSHSSSSVLNLHLYTSPTHPLTHTHPHTHTPTLPGWPYDCIEEDELEQDLSTQPSMMTESSELSSHSVCDDGVSVVSVPLHTPLLMDTLSSRDPPSFLSSSAPSSTSSSSSSSSSVLFHKEQELLSEPGNFITASPSMCVCSGLSTVV
ncbi:pleckstrin homology domain-containing family G member 4B isoform X2 [Hoplias malabaricus]|uniref:pleckstrin homology domain-containing family G member 4B isoform X2 n=1 Tax=Hoplias malabaricus TaxID=27720 RepID=UPI0034625F49